jgi:hypothetical protein
MPITLVTSIRRKVDAEFGDTRNAPKKGTGVGKAGSNGRKVF